MSSDNSIFEIKHVTKYYGSFCALQDFTCTLDNGVYGILGKNGAGKTTLIQVLVGLMRPSSGEVSFNGHTLKEMGKEYFKHLGYLPQAPNFYPNYRIDEFLSYMAELKGIKRPGDFHSLLEQVNLWSERKKKIAACSGGMKQRLGIAQALIGEPSILIFDEPSAGLDPLERIRLRNLISELGKNKIILIATHIVSDIEYIAKKIILLKRGQISEIGSVEKLADNVKGQVWELSVESESAVIEIRRQHQISSIIHLEQGYLLRILSSNCPDNAAISVSPNLEDIFLWDNEENGLYAADIV